MSFYTLYSIPSSKSFYTLYSIPSSMSFYTLYSIPSSKSFYTLYSIPSSMSFYTLYSLPSSKSFYTLYTLEQYELFSQNAIFRKSAVHILSKFCAINLKLSGNTVGHIVDTPTLICKSIYRIIGALRSKIFRQIWAIFSCQP